MTRLTRRRFISAAAAAVAGCSAGGQQIRAIVGPGAVPAGINVVNAPLPPGEYVGEPGAVLQPGLLFNQGGFTSLFARDGDFALSNLTLQGIGFGDPYASGFAIFTTGSVALDRVTLDNWRASYWACARGAGNSLTATGCRVVTRPGNRCGPAEIAGVISAALVAIEGADLSVSDTELDLDYIDIGAAVFGPGAARSLRNTYSRTGLGDPTLHPGAPIQGYPRYSLVGYELPYPVAGQDRYANAPSLLHSEGDRFLGSARCGVYCASVRAVEVWGGEFRDIVTLDNDQIPMGAIAMDDCLYVDVRAPAFHNCRPEVVERDQAHNFIFAYPEAP